MALQICFIIVSVCWFILLYMHFIVLMRSVTSDYLGASDPEKWLNNIRPKFLRLVYTLILKAKELL